MLVNRSIVIVRSPWTTVAVSILLYVLVFAPLRAVVGDVVGALSAAPVLIAGSLFGRRRTWVVAMTMIAINGAMFAFTEITRPSEEWQGAVLGALMLLITAELIGRVRENANRLKKSSESKDRFLAAVSHELRTPLTAVVGYTSILKRKWSDLDDTEREELLSVLHQQSAEVASIVEDLLVAARLDSDDVSFSVGKISLAHEVDVVASSLTIPPGTELTVSISDDEEVISDAGRLRQILRNLLSNAFRYGGARVTVEAAQLGQSVVITVRDDGTGLPREEWGSIFDSYYRSHNSAGQPDAVGLGLSVSRRLARRMGGDLSYRYVGGESRFQLALPASRQMVLTEYRAPNRLIDPALAS